jgi:hypothetical protein
MTQDELDALPDVTPSIGQQERIIDGQRVVVPVMRGDAGALFQPEDGAPLSAECGRTGVRYMIGWSGGARVKRVLLP